MNYLNVIENYLSKVFNESSSYKITKTGRQKKSICTLQVLAGESSYLTLSEVVSAGSSWVTMPE